MISNPRKRHADPTWETSTSSRTFRLSQPQPLATAARPIFHGFKPAIVHSQHPDSRLCQNFHWVPYPLGLMPYDSWHIFHNDPECQSPQIQPFSCPRCRKARKSTPHIRKLFLVAERLTWEEGLVPIEEKQQNEMLNWKVNYELGITCPFVEDPEHVPGGKKSQTNKWHPYQNEYEMELAFRWISQSENISEANWGIWMSGQMYLQKLLDANESMVSKSPSEAPNQDGPQSFKPEFRSSSRAKPPETIETIDLTVSPVCAQIPRQPPLLSRENIKREGPSPAIGTATLQPRMSLAKTPVAEQTSTPGVSNVDKRVISYRTLQDFYSLLDQLERSSYAAALFLQAYAEYLHSDVCTDCWLEDTIGPADTESSML